MQKKKRGRLAACFLAFCMAFSMLLYVPEGAWKVSADSLQTYDGLMYLAMRGAGVLVEDPENDEDD